MAESHVYTEVSIQIDCVRWEIGCRRQTRISIGCCQIAGLNVSSNRIANWSLIMVQDGGIHINTSGLKMIKLVLRL